MIPELTPFTNAADDPFALAGQLDTPIIGHLCSYVPCELIHAAGCHPFRLFPSGTATLMADNHLQAYCCSQVKGILEDCLSGRLEFLSGMVFAHTCDTLQRLSDIWRLNTDLPFFADMALPAKLNTQAAQDYFFQVMKKIQKELEAYSGKPITDQALEQSNQLYNSLRTRLSALYDLKSQFPDLMSGNVLRQVIKGTMLLPPQTAVRHLDTLLEKLSAESHDSQKTMPPAPKRILLSGAVCDVPAVFEQIEAAGAAVVADDLCTGQRWFEGLVAETGPPLENLARRYSTRVICPAKHLSPTARAQALKAKIERCQADGVIFTHLKFCDPHAFDLPDLKAALGQDHIPVLVLELDSAQQGAADGQLATRIETFIQMMA